MYFLFFSPVTVAVIMCLLSAKCNGKHHENAAELRIHCGNGHGGDCWHSPRSGAFKLQPPPPHPALEIRVVIVASQRPLPSPPLRLLARRCNVFFFLHHKAPPKNCPRFGTRLREIAVYGADGDDWGSVKGSLVRELRQVLEDLETDSESQRAVGGEGYVQRR